MLTDPIEQSFGEGTERMTYIFPGYLGPQLEKHRDQGDVMVGSQNHLKVCFLIVCCLGWDSLKIGATKQREHLHVACVYGLAPFQHNVPRVVGLLTW